jgi:O-antigen/teichoic acid export membrane protein
MNASNPAEGSAQPRAGDAVTVARNAGSLVLGQAATTVLAIFLSAAVGRGLGAEDFGIYYLITTMSSFAYVIVEWGQPYFVIRRVARVPSQSGEMLGASFALRAVFAPLAALCTGLATWALAYPVRTRWFAVLLVVAMLPWSLSLGYGMVFRAADRMGRDALVSVSNKAFVLCLTLPLLRLGAGIPGVILAQGIGGAVGVALAALFYRRLAMEPLRVTSSAARAVLAGGTPVLAMTAASSVQPYLDAIVLSKLAPATAVGWFGAARNLLGTLMAPAVILGTAFYPTLARASADPAALRVEMRRALRPLLWLAALAGTGTYLFAGAAIAIVYGAQAYGPAATILEVFAPGLFLLFVDILLGNVIYACGRGTGFAVAKIASVVVGTILDVLLVPLCQARFGNGGIGIVLAFALSELVVFGGCVGILRQGLLPSVAVLDAARAIGSAAVTLLLFKALPDLGPWLGMPVCVVIFTGVSAIFGLIGREDALLFWRVIQRGRAIGAPDASASGR